MNVFWWIVIGTAILLLSVMAYAGGIEQPTHSNEPKLEIDPIWLDEGISLPPEIIVDPVPIDIDPPEKEDFCEENKDSIHCLDSVSVPILFPDTTGQTNDDPSPVTIRGSK